MLKDQVEYYLFHQILDKDFMSTVMDELGWWMYLSDIRRASVTELFLYLLVVDIILINFVIYYEDLRKGLFTMKKKFKIYLSILLCMILCLPTLSVKASGNGIFRAFTRDALEDVYTSNQIEWLGTLLSRESSYFDGYDYESFNDFSIFTVKPTDERVLYAFGGFNSATGNTQCVIMDLSHTTGNYTGVFSSTQGITAIFEDEQPSGSYITLYSYLYNASTGWSTYYGSSTQGINSVARLFVSHGSGEQVENTNYPGVFKNNIDITRLPQSDSNYLQYYVNYSSSLLTYVYDTNCEYFYNATEFWNCYYTNNSYEGSNVSNLFSLVAYNSELVQNSLPNYMNSPYFNGDEIVTLEPPSNDETNSNHMYFKSCEIGFCEPYGVNSFAPFGGAYFYIKYDVDQWILDNINDYDLYFSSTAYVSSRQYNGSKTLSLDPDGCICIPFSDIFTTDNGVISNGFVAAVSSKQIDQRFYKTYLYSIAGNKLQDFIDKSNSIESSGSNFPWSDIVHVAKETYFYVFNMNNFSETIDSVVQPLIIQMAEGFKNYKINTLVKLVDNSGNESGTVQRLFDLYSGSDTSTDNSGLTNENPYEEDDEDDTYIPSIPGEGDTVIVPSGNGTGSVNVYNMTPGQIKLTIDTGLEKFVNWYNTDSQVGTTVNKFWNSMGIFKNNPATELYKEYFGFLPSDFKDIILGVCTIGIVGSAFCILRKKLH